MVTYSIHYVGSQTGHCMIHKLYLSQYFYSSFFLSFLAFTTLSSFIKKKKKLKVLTFSVIRKLTKIFITNTEFVKIKVVMNQL